MSLWKNLEFKAAGEQANLDTQSVALMPLLKDVFSREVGHITEFSAEGYVDCEGEGEDDEDIDISQKFVDYMISKGGRLIHRHLSSKGNCIFLWKDGMVDLNCSGSYVSVSGLSQDEDLMREMHEYFNSQWAAPPERTGHIYAIMQSMMGLQLHSLGNAGIPLVAENYTPKVMEDYKFVIKDLQSESPSGRITIMRGPPGTGKTHLIRAMLMEVPDAMFVLISPEMVTNLAGPELLPLLLSHRGGMIGPIVLVLEDADKCLVAREKDNINSIQALLNLGDGILGSLLDLRIIATTNAKGLQLEDALIRKGRLSKMLDVEHLDMFTASNIFQRLLPGSTPLPKELTTSPRHGAFQMTLAEVYSLARDHGWAPDARKAADVDDDLLD